MRDYYRGCVKGDTRSLDDGACDVALKAGLAILNPKTLNPKTLPETLTMKWIQIAASRRCWKWSRACNRRRGPQNLKPYELQSMFPQKGTGHGFLLREYIRSTTKRQEGPYVQC